MDRFSPINIYIYEDFNHLQKVNNTLIFFNHFYNYYHHYTTILYHIKHCTMTSNNYTGGSIDYIIWYYFSSGDDYKWCISSN